MPTKLFEAIQKSKIILIQTSIEERQKRIVKDYFSYDKDEDIKNII